MRTVRLSLPFLIIFALLVFVAGCGGADDDTTAVSASETAATGGGAKEDGSDKGTGGGGSFEKAYGQGGEAGGTDGNGKGGDREDSEATGGGEGGQVTNGGNSSDNRGGLGGSKAKGSKKKKKKNVQSGKDQFSNDPKTRFIAEADAACARVKVKFEAELKSYLDRGLESTLKEADEIANKVVAPNLELQISEIRTVPFPPGDDGTIEALLVSLQNEADRIRAEPRLINGDPYAESKVMAQEYGFSKCGRL